MLRGGNRLRAVNKANEVINIDNQKMGRNRANNVPIFALKTAWQHESRMRSPHFCSPYSLTLGCYSGM